MKAIKTIAILNLILFSAFLFMEVYHFIFDYDILMRSLAFSYPCSLWFRIPHYLLSLLMIFCSISILKLRETWQYANLLLIACIGFIMYDVVSIVSMFIPFCKPPCIMCEIESLQLMYIFTLFEAIYLFCNRKRFVLKLQNINVLYVTCVFGGIFILWRIIYEYSRIL